MTATDYAFARELAYSTLREAADAWGAIAVRTTRDRAELLGHGRTVLAVVPWGRADPCTEADGLRRVLAWLARQGGAT